MIPLGAAAAHLDIVSEDLVVTDAGLRSYRFGGAGVSDKHAGFVVNYDHATAADVHAVIEHVQAEVKRQFGVELHPEVRFLGD